MVALSSSRCVLLQESYILPELELPAYLFQAAAADVQAPNNGSNSAPAGTLATAAQGLHSHPLTLTGRLLSLSDTSRPHRKNAGSSNITKAAGPPTECHKQVEIAEACPFRALIRC